MALLDIGGLLGFPERLNLIDLVTLVIVHKALHEVEDDLRLDTGGVEMALLQVGQETLALDASVKQTLQAFLGDLGLFNCAQVELVEVRDQLALVLRMVVQVVDEADYLLLETVKLDLGPSFYEINAELFSQKLD